MAHYGGGGGGGQMQQPRGRVLYGRVTAWQQEVTPDNSYCIRLKSGMMRGAQCIACRVRMTFLIFLGICSIMLVNMGLVFSSIMFDDDASPIFILVLLAGVGGVCLTFWLCHVARRDFDNLPLDHPHRIKYSANFRMLTSDDFAGSNNYCLPAPVAGRPAEYAVVPSSNMPPPGVAGFPPATATVGGYPPSSYPPSSYPPPSCPPATGEGYPPTSYPPPSCPPATGEGYPPASYPPSSLPTSCPPATGGAHPHPTSSMAANSSHGERNPSPRRGQTPPPAYSEVVESKSHGVV